MEADATQSFQENYGIKRLSYKMVAHTQGTREKPDPTTVSRIDLQILSVGKGVVDELIFYTDGQWHIEYRSLDDPNPIAYPDPNYTSEQNDALIDAAFDTAEVFFEYPHDRLPRVATPSSK